MRRWPGKYCKPLILITALIAMAVGSAGCQDYTFPTPEPPSPETQKPASTTFINSEDRATLAVYEHLLSLAQSHEAKAYLAEFTTTSDNWSAKSELFKDGTSVWYVKVDMSGVQDWKAKPYWQQASWFVYQDGRVIPSNRLQANALRIEADLQELSPALPAQ